MPDDPIFIIGTERSGSNLLRLILNAHSRIAVPHPPHILRYFAPIEAGYGDLEAEEPFARMADDMLLLLRVHIHPWGIPIDRQRLLAEARPRDAFGLLCGLYDQFLWSCGKARWGCKSTFMIDHVERVRQRFDDPRFVLLVRDPRDVAVSSRKSVFSPFHPWFTARLWAEQQHTGLQLLDRLPEQVLLLRYEDLLDDPVAAVRKLCSFLDEPFEEGMLSYHKTDAAQQCSHLSESWRNTASPVMRSNHGKYRQGLSARELRQVEAVCAPLMDRLGYQLEHSQDDLPQPEPSGARLAARSVKDLGWRVGVEWRSLRHDRNHWRRWARDVTMGYLDLRHRILHPR